jgi:hypothetical protein
MYKTRNGSQHVNVKDAVVGDGIKQVLPSAKVRLMNVGNVGKGVVEMRNNEKSADSGKKPLTEKNKQAEKSGQNKYDLGEEEEYIDDKANDKKPKVQNQLDTPQKPDIGQKNSKQVQ